MFLAGILFSYIFRRWVNLYHLWLYFVLFSLQLFACQIILSVNTHFHTTRNTPLVWVQEIYRLLPLHHQHVASHGDPFSVTLSISPLSVFPSCEQWMESNMASDRLITPRAVGTHSPHETRTRAVQTFPMIITHGLLRITPPCPAPWSLTTLPRSQLKKKTNERRFSHQISADGERRSYRKPPQASSVSWFEVSRRKAH